MKWTHVTCIKETNKGSLVSSKHCGKGKTKRTRNKKRGRTDKLTPATVIYLKRLPRVLYPKSLK